MFSSRFAALLLASSAIAATPVMAQQQPPQSSQLSEMARQVAPVPQADLPPILKKMQAEQGTNFIYLGNEGGMAGYLGEGKTLPGEPPILQAFYVAPDGKHVVVGLMVTDAANGKMFQVTGYQLMEMKKRYQQKLDQAQNQFQSQFQTQLGGMDPQSQLAQFAPQPSASNSLEERLDIKPFDGAAFEAAFEKAAYFNVGVETAPTLYMVVDPTCQHCHETWKKLFTGPKVMRDGRQEIDSPIHSKKVNVKVVIASILGEESTSAALSILSWPNPAEAFVNHGLGSTAKPVPAPPSAGEKRIKGEGYLERNMKLVAEMEIEQTPFLAYKRADGTFRYQYGTSADINEFLKELPPGK